MDSDQENVWKQLCRGTRIEYNTKIGQHRASNPQASGDKPAQSKFQDPKAYLTETKYDLAGDLNSKAKADTKLAPCLDHLKINGADYMDLVVLSKGQPRKMNIWLSMSPEHCTIIGVNALTYGINDVPPKDLPYRWSDIAFLGWTKVCELQRKPVSELKYVIQQSITLPDTVKAIRQCAPKLGKWPGETWPISRQEAQTMLGTPSAMGTGYMLLQHEGTFGKKKVLTVQVWQEPTEPGSFHMLLTLGDGDTKEPKKDDFRWTGPKGELLPKETWDLIEYPQ